MTRTPPSLGPLRTLFLLRGWRGDRIALLHRAARKYGDVVELRLPRLRIYVLASAEIAHAMLVDNPDAFIKSLGLRRFARPVLGDGLLTSEHDVHRRQRRLIAPAFTAKRIVGYAAVMSELAERAAESLAEGAVVDVTGEMMRLTLAIVARTLFDAEVDAEAGEIARALDVTQAHVTRQVTHPLRSILHGRMRGHVEFEQAIARLDATIYRMIAERRAAATDRVDLLSMLLAARDDDGSGMTDLQVRDEAMTLFLAGHETTSNALAWSFHLLAEHPAARERLESEVDAVLGGRAPEHADLPRLPFARQVIEEAMRLYPPAYIIGREAQRDVDLDGLAVRRGSFVFVDIAGMHRRAEYFPDPDRFDPDRFSPERVKTIPRGAYLPFGGGPRICIGNHFALMEGQLLLAALAQRLRFEPVRPGPIATEPLVTLRPRDFAARVRRRRAA